MPSLQSYKKYTQKEIDAYVQKQNRGVAKIEKEPINKRCFELGRRIAELRTKARLPQVKLGELVGTTQSVIARIESGRHNLTIKKIEAISKALGRDFRIIVD